MESCEDEVKATQPSSILPQNNHSEITQGNPFSLDQDKQISLEDAQSKNTTIDKTPPTQLVHQPITDSPNIALKDKIQKKSSFINKNPLLKKLSGTFSDAACLTINTSDIIHNELFSSAEIPNEKRMGTDVIDKPNERRMGTDIAEKPNGRRMGTDIEDRPNERRMGTDVGMEEAKGISQSMNTILTKQSTPIEKKELIENKRGLFLGTVYETTSNHRFGCNPVNTCCNMF